MTALLQPAVLALSAAVLRAVVTEQPATLTQRQSEVMALVDANDDGGLDCAEVAAFLEPAIVERLRAIGVEPRRSSAATPCGPALPERGPESDFATFMRDQVRSVMNLAAGAADENDVITPNEIAAFESAELRPPLAGTIRDLLGDSAKPRAAAKSWSDVLADWINIRQSFLDQQGIGKPAKVSLSTHGVDDETVKPGDARRVWQFKAAVTLDPPVEMSMGPQVHFRPIAAYELNIASNTPEKDQIVHRVGFSSLIERADSTAPFSSHIVDVTFDYRTDRGYDAQVFGATLEYTPHYRGIGIGQYLKRGAPLDFTWRPYLGMVIADVRKAGAVKAYQAMSSYNHQFLKLAGHLKLGPSVSVTPEATMWHGLRTAADGTESRWQKLASIDGRWILSQSHGEERASLSLTATVGRDSPDFLKTRELTLALAVKF